MTVITSVVYGLISMRTRGIFFLMVTLAAGMVCYGIAFRWSSVTGGDNGLTGISRPPGLTAYWQFYFFVLAIFVIVTIALVITSRSPFGLAMRGIRDSETRMRSLGYNVANYKFVAVFLSGIVAGIAGVLAVWQFEFISPSAGGFDKSAMVMVMVIIGGIGTLFGPSARRDARRLDRAGAEYLCRSLADDPGSAVHRRRDLRPAGAGRRDTAAHSVVPTAPIAEGSRSHGHAP